MVILLWLSQITTHHTPHTTYTMNDSILAALICITSIGTALTGLSAMLSENKVFEKIGAVSLIVSTILIVLAFVKMID